MKYVLAHQVLSCVKFILLRAANELPGVAYFHPKDRNTLSPSSCAVLALCDEAIFGGSNTAMTQDSGKFFVLPADIFKGPILLKGELVGSVLFLFSNPRGRYRFPTSSHLPRCPSRLESMV